MIYRLPEIISKQSIYNIVIPDLTKEFYGLKSGDKPAISLVETVRIDANAIPVLAGMLTLLNIKTSNPVFIELSYNPRLIAFLYNIGFFTSLKHRDIIEYQESFIGGFQEKNCLSKLGIYNAIPYFESKKAEDKQEIRDSIAEKIHGDLLLSPLFKMNLSPINNDMVMHTTLIAAVETIVNAMIYSGSGCFWYVQTGVRYNTYQNGHVLSIVDIGKGFYYSLSEKIRYNSGYAQEEREFFYSITKSLGIDETIEKDFLSIMEALYYSEKRDREFNLFKLKTLLATNKANLRIHHKSREIVFSYNRCHNCTNRESINCVRCLWEKGNNTAIKRYNTVMAGVHIDIEFITGDGNYV